MFGNTDVITMATIKSFTSLEQSRKLAEFLPLESADMYYMETSCNNYTTGVLQRLEKDMLLNKAEYYKMFPCWSLAALLSVLPDEVEDNHFLSLQKEKNEYCCCYEDINGNSFRHTFGDNPIDACYEMTLKLKEKTYCNRYEKTVYQTLYCGC